MLFSAAVQPQQPMQHPAAAELLARLLRQPSTREQPLRHDDQPDDLDQRVRESGEW